MKFLDKIGNIFVTVFHFFMLQLFEISGKNLRIKINFVISRSDLQ